jgi:ATP-dependent RNA helicase DeaD
VNVLRALDPPSALVFRATREAVQHTTASLAERGFAVVGLSGELTQPERTRALKALRDGRARVLVATDVAARGLDLPGIALVLHADVPRDPQALQHRSGRTGRAGKKGLALFLAAPAERFRLERMLREAGIAAVWGAVPGPEEIRARDAERLSGDVVSLAGGASDEEREAARRHQAQHEPLAVAIALVRRERARLPPPEELPETARAASEAPAPRGPRAPRRGPPQDVVWFRVLLGRERNADPRWILPLVCRRGGVGREQIGKIEVLPRETRFEVARAAAGAFAAAALRPDPRMPDARIEPLLAAPRPASRPPHAKGAHPGGGKHRPAGPHHAAPGRRPRHDR